MGILPARFCAEATCSDCLVEHHEKKGPANRRAFANRKSLEETPRSGRFFFDD
jgi:hypothetical protein